MKLMKNKECNRVINEIWSMMRHKHTLYKIYSFLLFVKYKLQNKILDNKLLSNEPQSRHSKYSTELFSRTDQIINLIFEKIGEHFHEESCEIIIDRGMNPVNFVLSKLALESSQDDKQKGKLRNFLKENIEKFEYHHDLHTYLKSLINTREVVDDIFETTVNEENADFQVYEHSRDHEGLEDSLQIEAISTLFEEVNNKTEIEYLNQNYASIVENTLINLDYLNVQIIEGKEKDKIIISKIVTLIMISLYNLRQQYKNREESKKESSPGNFKRLKKRFKSLKDVIDSL